MEEKRLISDEVFKTIEFVGPEYKDELLELFSFLREIEDKDKVYCREFVNEFAGHLEEIAGAIASVGSVNRVITNKQEYEKI